MAFTPYGATVGNQLTPLSVANGGTGQTSDALPPFLPSDSNLSPVLLAWAYDQVIFNVGGGTVLPNAGQVTMTRINLRTAVSVTNVVYWVAATGSVLTSGQNFAGLYNSSGTLIGASADRATAWGSTGGLYTDALVGGPFTAGPGFVWVAWMCNGTTGPQIQRAGNTSATLSNVGFSAVASARFCHGGATGTTSMPNQTPASNVLTTPQFWAALS